jgi:hypothetical protein
MSTSELPSYCQLCHKEKKKNEDNFSQRTIFYLP